jgi:putative addiction module component (TIGR02574 family)
LEHSMNSLLEQLKASASNLPAGERAELADYLLDSLEPIEEGAIDAWRAELTRRIDEIRSRKVVGRPLEDVLARLRERYP